jgi:UDP-N-acetylglucosamine 3-dehydrogenase
LEVVKISVIGVGFWGRNHVRVLSGLEGVTVEAVYDVNLEAAKSIAERYNCKVASNLEEAIEKSDAITVCTPTSTHFEIALKALEMGRHVLVEKPITAKSSEALALVKRANERGLLLMVGHIERYNPGFRRLYDLIRGGGLGELMSIKTKRVSGGALRVSDVGVALDLAIHDVDLAMLLAGSAPLRVYSMAGSRISSHEDFVYIMMEFENSVQGYVEASWLTKRKIRAMEVTGTEGVAELDYLSQEVSVKLSDKEFKLCGPWVEPLKLELENFIKSIKGVEKPVVTGVDGYRALKCVELALEASRMGRPVRVEFEV